MWGRQNNCAGIAHEGENFGQLCIMLSRHPIVLFLRLKSHVCFFVKGRENEAVDAVHSIAVVMFESLCCNDKITVGKIIMSPKKNTVSSS